MERTRRRAEDEPRHFPCVRWTFGYAIWAVQRPHAGFNGTFPLLTANIHTSTTIIHTSTTCIHTSTTGIHTLSGVVFWDFCFYWRVVGRLASVHKIELYLSQRA